MREQKRHALRIIFTALQGVQQLAYGHYSGVTGIIIYIRLSKADSLGTYMGQQLDAVAAACDAFRDQGEMQRGHLRDKNEP